MLQAKMLWLGNASPIRGGCGTLYFQAGDLAPWRGEQTGARALRERAVLNRKQRKSARKQTPSIHGTARALAKFLSVLAVLDSRLVRAEPAPELLYRCAACRSQRHRTQRMATV